MREREAREREGRQMYSGSASMHTSSTRGATVDLHCSLGKQGNTLQLGSPPPALLHTPQQDRTLPHSWEGSLFLCWQPFHCDRCCVMVKTKCVTMEADRARWSSVLCALTRCCSHRGRSTTHPQTDGHQWHRCRLWGEGGEEAFVDHCLQPHST